MKKSLYFVFTILLSIITINVVNATEEVISFNRTTNYNIQNINQIIGKKDGYLIVENTQINNTIIHNYDNKDIEVSSKELENLTNSNLIKYNEDYLLVGISSNTLKVYLLDSNFQVKEQKETSYIIDSSSTLKLYKNNNKVLILLTENGELSNNNVYEIDEELNIFENRFSSFDGDYLKNTLKDDYYLISNNNVELNDRIINYKNSTYNEDKIILIGSSSNINYEATFGYEEKAHITIKDYENNIVLDKDMDTYFRFIDIELVKNRLFILAEKLDGTYLVTYDLDGNYLNETSIPNALTIDKVGSQIVINTKNDIGSTMYFYTFDCIIETEENILGTIKVNEFAKPHELVTISVEANSGYELESILVKDSQGNIIDLSNNTFIMPENDVQITTNYVETLSNPETTDTIFIISFMAFIISAATIFFYRKLRWLK